MTSSTFLTIDDKRLARLRSLADRLLADLPWNKEALAELGRSHDLLMDAIQRADTRVVRGQVASFGGDGHQLISIARSDWRYHRVSPAALRKMRNEA